MYSVFKLPIQKLLIKMGSVSRKKIFLLIAITVFSGCTVFAAVHYFPVTPKTVEPSKISSSKKDGSVNGIATSGGTPTSSAAKGEQKPTPANKVPSNSTPSNQPSNSNTTELPTTSTNNQQVAPVAKTLSYSRVSWEGGSNYWAQFPKAATAGWTNTNFFPITIFYGKADPTYVASLKDAGINTFAPPEHDPSTFPITNITNQGMYVIANINE